MYRKLLELERQHKVRYLMGVVEVPVVGVPPVGVPLVAIPPKKMPIPLVSYRGIGVYTKVMSRPILWVETFLVDTPECDNYLKPLRLCK